MRSSGVAWSVYSCCQLLQMCSIGVVGLSMRLITTDAQLWHGQSIHAAHCCWGYGRTTGWSKYRLCLAFVVYFFFNDFCQPLNLEFRWTDFNAVFAIWFRYGCR